MNFMHMLIFFAICIVLIDNKSDLRLLSMTHAVVVSAGASQGMWAGSSPFQSVLIQVQWQHRYCSGMQTGLKELCETWEKVIFINFKVRFSLTASLRWGHNTIYSAPSYINCLQDYIFISQCSASVSVSNRDAK